MTNTNITSFRKNIFSVVDRAVTYGEVLNVHTKNGTAVLLSEEDYRNMMETLHLSVIPGMVESIQKAAEEPLDTCVPYDPSEPW